MFVALRRPTGWRLRSSNAPSAIGLAASLAIGLAGCTASIEGAPPRLLPIATETEVLKAVAGPDWYKAYAGEPWLGKEAVAHVVLNRARSGRYPASATEVCLQPKQFSCWNANDPNFPKIRNLQPGADPVFDNCCEIAEKALHGLFNDPTGGALHYHADYIDKPSWVIRSPNAKLTAMIGHHLFYTGIA